MVLRMSPESGVSFFFGEDMPPIIGRSAVIASDRRSAKLTLFCFQSLRLV
jgi:hypothetical protein